MTGPSGARRPRVVEVGVDPDGPGGMAAVVRGLHRSPLAAEFDLHDAITYRSEVRGSGRVVLLLRALAVIVGHCLRPGPVLVHVHLAVRGSWYRKAVCVLAAKACRRPVLLHFHSGAGELEEFLDTLSDGRRRLLVSALRRADRVASVSAAGARVLEQRTGLGPVHVAPNAPPPTAADRSARPGTSTTVLYLGGFQSPAKGGTVLLAALQRLPEHTELTVLLAGPGGPPPGWRPVHDRVLVRSLGYLDETGKAAALAEAGVVVVPSVSEGMPVWLLEAMSAGVALVASATGGIPEVVVDGEHGLLVPPGDPEALAAALHRLVQDRGLRSRLGEAARQRCAALAETSGHAALRPLFLQLLERPTAVDAEPARASRSR